MGNEHKLTISNRQEKYRKWQNRNKQRNLQDECDDKDKEILANGYGDEPTKYKLERARFRNWTIYHTAQKIKRETIYTICKIKLTSTTKTLQTRGAGMAQWWEHSLRSHQCARVRPPVPVSCVGWVCCWFSSLFQEVFLRVLRFSPLLKNQRLQIPIRSSVSPISNALCTAIRLRL